MTQYPGQLWEFPQVYQGLRLEFKQPKDGLKRKDILKRANAVRGDSWPSAMELELHFTGDLQGEQDITFSYFLGSQTWTMTWTFTDNDVDSDRRRGRRAASHCFEARKNDATKDHKGNSLLFGVELVSVRCSSNPSARNTNRIGGRG